MRKKTPLICTDIAWFSVLFQWLPAGASKADTEVMGLLFAGLLEVEKGDKDACRVQMTSLMQLTLAYMEILKHPKLEG